MSTLLRRFVLAAIVGSALGSTVFAQNSNPNDLLNKANADRAILTQRIEGKLREALGEARRLQGTSQVRAVNALKAALGQLDDPLIPTGFRNEWTATLTAQIKQIESGKKLADPAEINPVKREIKEADRQRAKAIQEEYNDVRRTLDTVAALNRSGSAAQAQKEIAALAKRYPDNPATIIMSETSGLNQRLADARYMVAQQQEGFLLAMRSVDKSAIMPKDPDIDFDVKRWREISKLRMKSTLTKKEEALLKALDSPINLGYKDAPFDEVMKALSTALGKDILLDKSALESAMIDSNTPTTINVRGVAVRTALRKVLQDRGLTYIIKDESIQVVTLDRAKETLVTRVYHVGDLVNAIGPFGGVLHWGPQLNMMQVQENANQLIDMIKKIDADSWKDRGGNGVITFHWPSMSIIVRQTSEFHARFGGSIGGR